MCDMVYSFTSEQIRARAMSSPAAFFDVISRGVKIVWSLAFYWSNLSIDFMLGTEDEMVPKRAEQLRRLLCELGPSFIKAGQV